MTATAILFEYECDCQTLSYGIRQKSTRIFGCQNVSVDFESIPPYLSKKWFGNENPPSLLGVNSGAESVKDLI